MDSVISNGVQSLDEITAQSTGSSGQKLVIEHLDLVSDQHIALLSWCIRTEPLGQLAA